MKVISIVLLLSLAALVSFQLDQVACESTVMAGSYLGVSYGNYTKAFLGIRYAESTGGNNRFAPPVPVRNDYSVKNATSFGNICMQVSDANMRYDQPQSEDCLFLNVWAPMDATTYNQYPVVVWIHGNDFTHGSGNLYDGNHFVKTSIENNSPIVFVSINYRLGIFGFAADKLFKSGNSSTTTNFGLLDQLAALNWVRNNIQTFGGNQYQITIAGQSAGGTSALILLTSPLFKNLILYFNHAIIQSGSTLGRLMESGNSTGLFASASLKEQFFCSTVECLRSLSAEDINQFQQGIALNSSLAFGPSIDNYVMHQNPYEALKQGKYPYVNFLIGSTLNEMSSYTCGSIPSNPGYYDYLNTFQKYFGYSDSLSIYPTARSYYNCTNYSDGLDCLNDMLTQSVYQCNARYISGVLNRNNYLYLYNHSFPFTPKCLQNSQGVELAIQFPSLLKNMISSSDYSLSSEEIELSKQIIVYWSNFARSGSPNRRSTVTNAINLRNSQVYWNQYSVCNDSLLFIEPGSSKMVSNTLKKNCDFWSTFDKTPILTCSNGTNPTPYSSYNPGNYTPIASGSPGYIDSNSTNNRNRTALGVAISNNSNGLVSGSSWMMAVSTLAILFSFVLY